MNKICAYQPTICVLNEGNPEIRINYFSEYSPIQNVVDHTIVITAVMTGGGGCYLKIVKEGSWDSTYGSADWSIDKDTFEKLGKDMALMMLRGYFSFTVGRYNSNHLPNDGFTTINIYEPMNTKLAKAYESFCQMMYDAIMAQ